MEKTLCDRLSIFFDTKRNPHEETYQIIHYSMQFPIFKWHKKTEYLCMVEWAEAPKRFHKSYKEAKNESIRLNKVTWKPTYLLQVMKKYETEVTEVSYKHVCPSSLEDK